MEGISRPPLGLTRAAGLDKVDREGALTATRSGWHSATSVGARERQASLTLVSANRVVTPLPLSVKASWGEAAFLVRARPHRWPPGRPEWIAAQT